jgi:Clp amino terminal domain, pathogenicity island component
MRARSYALETVWQYAAEEAVAVGSDHIEPEHLLIGICSIEKLFSAGLSSSKLTPYSLASIRSEWQELLALLLDAKLTPSTLRRELRKRIPAGSVRPGTARTVSRSGRSRAIFARAEQIAAAAGSTLVGIIYLLAALLEDGPIRDLLGPFCKELAGFQEAVTDAARRPLQAKPMVAQKASISASTISRDKALGTGLGK